VSVVVGGLGVPCSSRETIVDTNIVAIGTLGTSSHADAVHGLTSRRSRRRGALRRRDPERCVFDPPRRLL
jgi:hypothetical protein